MGQLALFPQADCPLSPAEREFFPTPHGIADFATRLWKPPRLTRPKVLDPGAGEGVWGQAFKKAHPQIVTVGVDLPLVPRAEGYDFWFSKDFGAVAERFKNKGVQFDLVVSNPPFSMAEDWLVLSHDLLRPGGMMIYFLRLAFLAGQDRGVDIWRKYPLRALTVSSKRPSFTGDGISDTKTEYALFVWKKGYHGPSQLLPPFNYSDVLTWAWSDDYAL